MGGPPQPALQLRSYRTRRATDSQADSVAKPVATGTSCPPSSGRCRTGGAFVDRCDKAGCSTVPRLVACQMRAQLRDASGVRAGHGLAGGGSVKPSTGLRWLGRASGPSAGPESCVGDQDQPRPHQRRGPKPCRHCSVGLSPPLLECTRTAGSGCPQPVGQLLSAAYRTAATCALTPWTAVTSSNRAGRHRAVRHGRRWADPADRRQAGSQRPKSSPFLLPRSSVTCHVPWRIRGEF